jgi:peptide/nickel transport system ATP-binding protein
MSALNPTMRVGRQMTDVLRRARPQLDKGQLVRAAHEILAAVGLTDGAWIMRAYPFQLSGGMRQRVMIALAYGCRPALIIADEPTTALDVTLQAQVLDLILALNGQVKSAMLFISHDLAIVRRICTRLYVMRKGEVVESGACAQIIASPQHEYTKTLLASARAKEASP